MKASRKARKLAVVESKVYDSRQPQRSTASFAGDQFFQRLTDKANHYVTRSGEEKQRFCTSFDQDPARALEWSRDAFQTAGRLRVAQYILGVISNVYESQVDEYTLVSNFNLVRSIRNELYRNVINSAKYAESSTSATSNLMERSILAAKAEFVEELDRWFDFHEFGFDAY